ncbi:hypothetical protein PMAYCL1PPCAC_10329, partial [Pristionchus mayeri]
WENVRFHREEIRKKRDDRRVKNAMDDPLSISPIDFLLRLFEAGIKEIIVNPDVFKDFASNKKTLDTILDRLSLLEKSVHLQLCWKFKSPGPDSSLPDGPYIRKDDAKRRRTVIVSRDQLGMDDVGSERCEIFIHRISIVQERMF